ncbi:MAG: trypsin-like serine protease [Gammaproteobacteria bacterium]|nr:trypsin-like serine protease [Gammaproteobacteria bacterium]
MSAGACPGFTVVRLLVLVAALCSGPAFAIMAGDPTASPADSPSLRVDSNFAFSPWAGVGSLSVKDGTYSAVAISPHFVLTAAHVVSGAAASDIVFNLNSSGDMAYRIPASATFVHPLYSGFRKDGIAFNDIALVRLSSDLPPATPVYGLLSEPADIGAIITLVGYGASGNGVKGIGVPANAAVKRVGQNVIDLFLPAVKRFEFPKAYLFDFDDPAGRLSTMGERSLGNRRETTVASGDSGSPAFVNENGRWLVAGINTFQLSQPHGAVPPLFGSVAGGMWVPAYTSWINQVMATPLEKETRSGYVWLVGFAALLGGFGLRKDRS